MCKGTGILWGPYPSAVPDPTVPKGISLEEVQGACPYHIGVTIPPIGTMNIQSRTDVYGHCICVHMFAEPAQGPWLPASIVLTTTYWELHPGSSWVPVCLRNLSAHSIVIPAKVIIGKVTSANQVPLVAFLMGTLGESACGPQKDWILDELNLQGLQDWPEEEKIQARELLTRWEHLFTYNDLDMGGVSLIKHQIELMDQTPFKECYQQIPLICTMMWRSICRWCWT